MEQETQKLSAWDRQLLIRDKNRPTVRDYIPRIFTDFYELHGDRGVGDDGALIGGICRLNGTPVTVLAQVKGRNIRENKASNFAMPHPEGYRKALRLAHQAEKFHRPVICLIDTPGAFCGVEAEERGQGEAIARNIAEFMMLRTPVISVVLGEAGSGGALALGVCDDLAMLENALYSVISPQRMRFHSVEGCVQRTGCLRGAPDHGGGYGAIWRCRSHHSGAGGRRTKRYRQNIRKY